MTPINNLKQWFRNGLKPTQEQFWAWMDSYWHKGEEIPQTSIKGLDKSLENKAETTTVDAKANKDATGLSEENKVAWKEALGVGKIPDNIAKIDTDSEQGNVYDKTQVDDLLENSGKNIGNSDLETTSTRTFTQAHIYTHNTAGYHYYITGLPDKSADTTFNKMRVQNADGQEAVSSGKAVMENLMANLPSVKDSQTGNYDLNFSEYMVYNPTTGKFAKSDRPQVVNNFPSQINVYVSDNVKNITIAPKPNYSQDVLDTLNYINRINEVNFTKFSTSQIVPFHIIDEDLPSSILSNSSQKSAIQNLVSVLKDGHIKYNGARGQDLLALYENNYVQDMIVKEKRAVVNVLFDKELPQNKEWCIRIESEMPYIDHESLTNCCIGFRNFKSNKCDAELSDVNFITNPHWDANYRAIQPKETFDSFIGVRSINFDLYIIKKGDLVTYLVQGRETGGIAIYTEPYSERYKYMYFFKFLPPSDRYRAINNYEFYLKNISYWVQP